MPLPTYPWFDQVPEHLKTRRQLAEQGLRPGGRVVAQVVWKRGQRFAYLYDVNAAKPKRQATPAQLAALEKAQAKRRTCYGCQQDIGMVIWRDFRARYDCPNCSEAFERQEQEARDLEAKDACREAAIWLASPRTVILDTETTDLYGYLVQITVIDTTGAVLFDSLVNPEAPINPDAQRIHGLTEEQLKDAPTFAQIEPALATVLRGKRIVSYNAAFDRGILQNELRRLYEPPRSVETGYDALVAWSDAYKASTRQVAQWLRRKRWRCAMELYAVWAGEWSDYHGSYRWQPLPGGDHSALGDARACLRVLERMAEAYTKS